MNLSELFHKRNFSGRGDIYVVFIMGIIIAASTYLVGGLIPDIEEQPPVDAEEYEVSTKRPKRIPGIGMQMHELTSKKVPTIPQPTPGNDPGTPPTSSCSENMAVNFLIDLSESMYGTGDGTQKIVNVRSALRSFYPNLPDKALFGMTTFATRPEQRMPIQEYIDAKGQIAGEIERLVPYTSPNGATYMKDGFTRAREAMINPIDAFGDHKFNLIVISDGVPELVECRDPYCEEGAGRNYDPSQDPVIPANGNIADQIKEMGVSIYTVAIYNTDDLEISNKLRQIMRDASSGDGYYYDSPDAQGLTDILAKIKEDTCR